MVMNGNKNKPKKPSKEDKERRRKERNKRKAASKIIYRFDQPEKEAGISVAVIQNVFWFKGIDGVFSVLNGRSEYHLKHPVRKYKVKKLAMDFCRKANSKV